MIVEMVDPKGQALREIADPRMKRDDVALTYAFMLRHLGPMSEDYSAVNKAIVERWSLAALKYIKERAWKLAEGRIQP